jgi:hypothetical protein
MPKTRRPATPSLAANLRALLRRRRARMSLGDLTTSVDRGDNLGPVLFVLTLPVLAPLPPGVSVVLAVPLLLVALQIVVGRQDLWLPKWLSARTFEQKALAKLLRRALPAIERLESLAKPRLRVLTGFVGSRIIGLACTLIAMVLILPIPFANLVPALAMGCLSLGLMRKDGLLVLAGYSLMALAVGVIALGVHGASLGIGHLRALF